MRVLLIQRGGDDGVVRELERTGLEVTAVSSAAAGWSALREEPPDVVVADLGVGRDETLALVRRIREGSDLPVVVSSRAPDVPTAVGVLKGGASDFYALPAELEQLARRAHRLAEIARRESAADPLERVLVGRSTAMVRVRERVRALAPLGVPVLVAGERGAGRDAVIGALHAGGAHAGRPLVRVEPGSPRKADPGRTYYLDELTEMAPPDQAFWADALQRGAGSLRVLASSSRDLEGLARQERFDPALASALARFTIALPALRERLSDLPELTRHLAARIGERLGRPAPRFERSALARLRRQQWSGNVAELADLIERVIAYSTTDRIQRAQVEEVLGDAPQGIDAMRRRREEEQRTELVALLDECGGNLAEVARRVGMSRGAIIYRAQKYGLLRRPG